MKILFDLSKTQPIGDSKFHGGGKYGIIVFKQLVKMAANRLAVYYDPNVYLDEDALSLIETNGLKVYHKGQIDLYEAASQEGGVLYTPLFNTTYGRLPPEGISLLVTQHGVRDLEMPSDSYAKYLVDKHISGMHRFVRGIRQKLDFNHEAKVVQRKNNFFSKKNIHFITVSEHSKVSMETFYPELRKRDIAVFYSPSTINKELTLEGYSNSYGKYWLIVSANRWVKNGLRAIQAFDELFTSHADLEGRVVVTGLKSWDEVDFKVVHKERFVLTGYVDEKTLKGLYHHAYALVYPSLNEGFGYPPLEAMHEGCPVIASSIASIPEICGDSVLYFNPYLISEVKMRILQMENQEIRMDYAKRGKLRQQQIEIRQNEDLQKMCKYVLSFLKEN